VAGAEGLAEQLDVPVFGGPGAGRDLPFDPIEVGEGSVIEVGDVPLRVVETPGLRPDHVAFMVGERSGEGAVVLAGDLDGVRGARSMPGPVDEAALARSVARLRSVAPGAPWFGGHPRP
jgi:glyoxylase-like metal-dependent hydrolase (beta-lactamase superfamily II)